MYLKAIINKWKNNDYDRCVMMFINCSELLNKKLEMCNDVVLNDVVLN